MRAPIGATILAAASRRRHCPGNSRSDSTLARSLARMTVLALAGNGAVDDDGRAPGGGTRTMTHGASDVRVGAVEGKGRIPLMVESRRRPEGVESMTGVTIAALRSMLELVAVRVPVALGALGTSPGELENAYRRGRGEKARERGGG